MIGTTAALVIGGLAAGSQVAGAAIQAHSANKAAQTQADAGQQSLALQERGYNDAKTNLAPWMSQGQNAMQAINGRLGLPGNTGPVPVGASQTPAAMATGAMRRPPAGPVNGPPPSGGVNLGAFAQNVGRMGAAMQSGQGGQVHLRAPNGEELSVPADRADFYISKGAQRV